MKKRTPYGKLLDEHGIKQEDIARASGLSRNTVSYACSDPDFKPTRGTLNLLLMALKELTGETKTKRDFWA